MNNTLTNGFKILEYLAETAKPHSIKELAEAFKLPNSHICRLLKTLTETGYVEQEKGNRKYKVSLKILRLSNACIKRMEIRNRVRPYADKLSRELNQAVYLAAPHEGHALIVDVLYPGGVSNDASQAIGNLNIAHTTASGKICAAYQEDIDSYLETIELFKITDKTITDKKLFKLELEKIRREKVAVTDSEKGDGVAALACPLFNCNGEFVGGIGSMLPPGEHSSEQWDTFKEKIKEAAESASFALGYSLQNLV